METNTFAENRRNFMNTFARSKVTSGKLESIMPAFVALTPPEFELHKTFKLKF